MNIEKQGVEIDLENLNFDEVLLFLLANIM